MKESTFGEVAALTGTRLRSEPDWETLDKIIREELDRVRSKSRRIVHVLAMADERITFTNRTREGFDLVIESVNGR